ncbi:rhomboid-related protein 3 [Gastrophryne carolinensis]
MDGGPSSSLAAFGGPNSSYAAFEDPSSSPSVLRGPSSTFTVAQGPNSLPAVVEGTSSSATVLRGPSATPAVAEGPQVEQIEVLESVELPAVEEPQLDGAHSGYVSARQFWTFLQARGSELEPHKLDVLLALANGNADGKIRYQDVVTLLSRKRSNSFRRAILQGNRQLCNTALLEEPGLSLAQRLVRHVAYEVLPREIDRKWFYDNYTGFPPPWFMITITIVEVAIFVYYGLVLDRFVLQVAHRKYLKNPLIFHPQLRMQAWRYLSYMLMHAGIEHLGVNVALQLLVGIPLEMVHGTTRIAFLYVAGVLAGSLAVSLADMTAPVVGSSGGVYAIVSAHLANIVMNWSGMRCQFKLLRMSFALICMSLEFGRAVWLRFYPSAYPPCPHPSFVAHLGGVLVGITLGVVVLRNFEQRLQDQTLWWVFLGIFVMFVVFAVLWNIFAFSMPGLRLPPPP